MEHFLLVVNLTVERDVIVDLFNLDDYIITILTLNLSSSLILILFSAAAILLISVVLETPDER